MIYEIERKTDEHLKIITIQMETRDKCHSCQSKKRNNHKQDDDKNDLHRHRTGNLFESGVYFNNIRAAKQNIIQGQ